MKYNLTSLSITYLVMNHNLTSYGLLIFITKNWPIYFLKLFILAYFLLFPNLDQAEGLDQKLDSASNLGPNSNGQP